MSDQNPPVSTETETAPNEDPTLVAAQAAARRLYPTDEEAYNELWPILWTSALDRAQRLAASRADLVRQRGRQYGV